MIFSHAFHELFRGFTLPTILLAIGLVLNTLGSMFPLFPFFSVWRSLDDDEIVNDRKDADGHYVYTRRGHRKERAVSLIGSGLLVAGFVLDFIGLVMQVRTNN